MKCPLCGKRVAEDDLFCGNCGYNLLQDEPDSDEASPAPESGEEGEMPVLDPVIEGTLEFEEAFALPTTGEDETPPKESKTWKTFVIAAVALLVVLCCCCSTAFALLVILGESA